jgi:hypothetical protein
METGVKRIAKLLKAKNFNYVTVEIKYNYYDQHSDFVFGKVANHYDREVYERKALTPRYFVGPALKRELEAYLKFRKSNTSKLYITKYGEILTDLGEVCSAVS